MTRPFVLDSVTNTFYSRIIDECSLPSQSIDWLRKIVFQTSIIIGVSHQHKRTSKINIFFLGITTEENSKSPGQNTQLLSTPNVQDHALEARQKVGEVVEPHKPIIHLSLSFLISLQKAINLPPCSTKLIQNLSDTRSEQSTGISSTHLTTSNGSWKYGDGSGPSLGDYALGRSYGSVKLFKCDHQYVTMP